MKSIPGFLIVSLLFSCSQKLYSPSTKSHEQNRGQILEKSIIDNPIPEKSGLTVMFLELKRKDTISGCVSYSSASGQGEIPGSLIDHLCTDNTLKEGYYKLQITSLCYDSLNIDSLLIEKGKKIFLKVGLHYRCY